MRVEIAGNKSFSDVKRSVGRAAVADLLRCSSSRLLAPTAKCQMSREGAE